MRWSCLLGCGDLGELPVLESVADHMRITHPGRYDEVEDAPQRWPDSGIVIYEEVTAGG